MHILTFNLFLKQTENVIGMKVVKKNVNEKIRETQINAFLLF